MSMEFSRAIALRKPKPYRSQAYMEWVRGWPCLACGTRNGIQAAHTGPHGLGTKASDFRVVPLCASCHLGPTGMDKIGPAAFEDRYVTDLKSAVLSLIEAYLSDGNDLTGSG